MALKKRLQKLIILSIGSIINAYGITLAIHAGFGSATLAVLWQGLTNILPVTLGQASFLVAAAMLIFCYFYDRKQIHIGTVLYQIIYSVFVDIFEGFHIYSAYRSLNFLIMLGGVAIQGFGIALYVSTNLGRGSYDALTFALVERNGWPVRPVRMALDLLLAGSGFLLGGKPGLCTIVFVLFSGTAIQFFLKQIHRFQEKTVSWF